MFKVIFSLVLAVATIAPAQAATTIVVNSGNTAITGSNAGVIRNFTTANANGATLTTVTNVPFPGGTFSDSKIIGGTTQNPGSVNVFETPTVLGMNGDYLAIGRLSSYTISFNTAVSYFSFAFNGVDNNSSLRFTYANNTTQLFAGPSGILGGSAATFGRVNYHTGTGPQIVSVEFLRANTGQGAFLVDDIAAAVPEPATWLMMILGFGLVGSQLRRRKVKVRFATA